MDKNDNYEYPNNTGHRLFIRVIAVCSLLASVGQMIDSLIWWVAIIPVFLCTYAAGMLMVELDEKKK
jgi:hypothetical protein